MMAQNFYLHQMQAMVQPMRDELTRIGFQELRTPEEVEEKMEGEGAKGTTLLAVNSVCGCAAGLARPAVADAPNNEKKPDHLYTVFAGQDKEATAKARTYLKGLPPSSPSFFLLKDGKVVHAVHRHDIENRSLEEISQNLKQAFDKYC